jgi:hypothetical protein
MKVLTHEGVLVTMPFTLNELKVNEFERTDGKGGSEVGTVTEMTESAVRRLVSAAGAIEKNYSTPRTMMNDIRFIARSLATVQDGVEIRMQSSGRGIKLVIPPEARVAKATVKAGARVAFNGRVSPKTMLNARGTVQSVRGGRATLKVDAGDRGRITEATGKDLPESTTAPVAILDVLDGEQS